MPIAEPPPYDRLVVDLRPQTRAVEGPTRRAPDFGLGSSWGAEWTGAAQGWVDRGPAGPAWRPVITTTDDFPDWHVETYLGIVTGEAAVEAHLSDTRLLGIALAEGREVALHGLVESGVARGAHAVMGVGLSYTQVGGRLLITASGTAVTLRERGD